MVKLNFETITPLHISNGNELAHNLTYVSINDSLFALDNVKLSSFLANKNVFDFSKSYSLDQITSIIDNFNIEITEHASKYKIFSTEQFVASLRRENRIGMTYVQEFINSNGSHYIPASSVKGALLTILKRESLGIINNIQQKFVINDSPNIPSSEFSVYRTGFGRPPVNLICLNPGTNFQINIQKLGDLSIKTLREKLSSHFPDQITKAKNVVKRFLSQKNLDAGANSFYDILEGLENLTLANDEYLFNLGFGGGSWFKIYSDTPPFKFSNPGKKGKKEEAHTVFLTIDDYTDPIGWCKLKIEE